MPLYSDLGIYYAPHLTTPSYYSSPFLGTSRSAGSLSLGLMPVPRLLPSRISPGYSPMPSIPESGYSSTRRALPSLDRTSPRAITPRYMPPKPLHIDTADIDVSAARFGAQRPERPDVPVGGDPTRQATIRRERTVVRLHTKKLKENPALDARRRMTPGEKLVQKFLILDKKEEEEKAARRKRLEELEERERVQAEIAKLQALAAKKAAADAEAPEDIAPDGSFAPDSEAPPPTQNFPRIQGLTENAALDILLSAEGNEEEVEGGDIARTGSTGTVKKRKIKDKDGTIKASKRKTKQKDGAEISEPAEDSASTGDEMVEKCTLQRRNTIRFRRNSDVEGFPEIESVPGSRRSSFDLSPSSRRPSFDQSPSSRRSSIDQSPSSRRSSMDSTGEEIPLSSEKKATVKRRKGPKHKIIADVSIDNSTSTEPRSPKFVVDEVKVEQNTASPRGAPKKFRYEVIVEDVEEESAAGRRGKSGKENKAEAVAKKKKAKPADSKPLIDRQDKSAPKVQKDVEEGAEKKETTPKSFLKSPFKPLEEANAQVASSKTDEISDKITQQKIKGKVIQDATPKLVTLEKTKESKPDLVDNNLLKTTGSETLDTKIDKKEKVQVPSKDKKLLNEPQSSKPGAKDIQKDALKVEKPKPSVLAAVVSKVDDAKLGKQGIEKKKIAKHQADPTPPPTPTIEKSDSGINFWDFLNGGEEVKTLKSSIPKEESLIQPEKNKNENSKETKVKPNLALNIQNKCTPAETILETTNADSKKIPFGKKINEKTAVKMNDENNAKFPRKSGDLNSLIDGIQNTKPTVNTQKEPQSALPKIALDQDSMKNTPITSQKERLIDQNLNTEVELPKDKQKVSLTSKTPDEKIPKWKAPGKDGIRIPDAPVTAGTAGTSETKSKDATSMSLISKTDETKSQVSVKETLETSDVTLPKVPETPEKKPPPKWKGFGKQPPPLASPKEAAWSPKPVATPEPKNADMKLKSQVSQASDISSKVSSPSHDAADGWEKPPNAAVASDILKIPEKNEAGKTPLVLQQKENSLNEDLPKKKPLVTQDSKESKSNKVSTPEEDSKLVPKWKVKAQTDKDAELKKTPLVKIKQTSSDKTLVSTVAPEPKAEESSPLEAPNTTTLSEPPSPTKEKDAAKTQIASNLEGKLLKTEPKPPADTEKPPKKPQVKNKFAAKLPETTPKESEVSNQIKNEKNVTALQHEAPVESVTPKVTELKTEEVEKPKDKFPLGKAKLTEQKSKEGEKDISTPLGKKLKVLDNKLADKKEKEEVPSPTENKAVNITTQKNKDEEKAELPLKQEQSEYAGQNKSEPAAPLKKGAKLIDQKSKDDVKSEPQSPIKKAKPVAQKSKEETEPSPVKKPDKLTTQKSDDSEEGKKEATKAAKKVPKLVNQKSKDDEKSEQSPTKKGGKITTQKSKEDDTGEAPPSPVKKVGKLAAQKSKEDNSEPTSIEKAPKLLAKKSKDEEKSEPSSPAKNLGKIVAQKGKDNEKKDTPAPAKKAAKLVAQKSKEESSDLSIDVTKDKPAPAKKAAKLVAQKSKEESSDPSIDVTKDKLAPAKKAAKLVAQKSKEESSDLSIDVTKDKLAPAKKAAKLVAQKSKEEPSEASTDVKKTTAPAKAKAKPKSAKKTEAEGGKGRKAPARPPHTLPPPTPPAPESGSDADSEDSSSEDDGGATPHASSSGSGSSCSSSDSGFDSRPSSVPVPSTASSEASGHEPGSPSPALARSQALDPYSEDAGLPRAMCPTGRTTPPASSLPRFRKYTVDDFQFLKLLGKGSFGKVLLAELRGTDRYYAVKCLKKDVVLEDDDVECTLIERKVLALGTKHPYLCHLFCTFQTESHLLFVMEYLNGGDLMFHIQQSGRFPEPRARFYGAEIVSGLKFLHKKGIVYRDLKLDNILLDYEGHVRIADFGMCKLQIFLDRTADTFCGTPDYMAPEIIKGLKYNQCVDWWSFGVLVFEMLVGVSPFTGCDEDELFWSICNEQPQYPRFLTREAHSLLQSLLEKDALKRLGTPSSPKGDVPDHVFFRSVDWDALERRELEPPFRPRVKHSLDVSYFDAAFTAERAELTPVDASILQSMDQAQFQGFSYTNPNATD